MSFKHPSLNLTLRRACLENTTKLADILVIAHRDNGTVSNLMKELPHEVEVEYYAHNLRSQMENESGFEAWEVVDEDTRQIIGFTAWHNPSSLSGIEHYPPLPAGANESLAEDFFGTMEVLEKKWFSELGGPENIYFLHYISVLPSHQGKGIGEWSLQFHLSRADTDRKAVLLIGTPRAQALYARLGFEKVDDLIVDLRGKGIEGGIDGKDNWAVMVRQPM